MDKAVIDELFAEGEGQDSPRHSSAELAETLKSTTEKCSAHVKRITELKEALITLQDEMRDEGNALQDLYDDLDFGQQSAAEGVALDRYSDELESAADELDAAVDALSDLLIFRFH